MVQVKLDLDLQHPNSLCTVNQPRRMLNTDVAFFVFVFPESIINHHHNNPGQLLCDIYIFFSCPRHFFNLLFGLVAGHACGGQRTTCRRWFSPSTLQVLRIKFKSPVWQKAPLPTEPFCLPLVHPFVLASPVWRVLAQLVMFCDCAFVLLPGLGYGTASDRPQHLVMIELIPSQG